MSHGHDDLDARLAIAAHTAPAAEAMLEATRLSLAAAATRAVLEIADQHLLDQIGASTGSSISLDDLRVAAIAAERAAQREQAISEGLSNSALGINRQVLSD